MRKLVGMMLVLIAFVACSDDKDELKEIVLDKGTSTEQTIYSDETSTKEGISFTALENWVAVVNEVSTRAESRVDWLELSQYSGGPGKFTLSITIAKNDTGSDRKAEIKIVSGGTVITVVVEQKAITSEEAGKEPGDDPVEPQTKKNVKTIKVYAQDEDMADVNEMYLDEQLDFSYDEQGKIVNLDMTDYWYDPMPNGGGEWKKDNEEYSFAYKKQDNGNLMIEVKSIETYPDMEYLYCDNTGKVVSAKRSEDNGESNPIIEEYQYVYDDQDQLVQTERKAVETNGPDPYTTDFTWSNHNVAAYKSTKSLFGSGNITYTDIENDGNIDLAYIVCFSFSTEMLAFPHGIEIGTIAGFFGKRVANMPSTVEGTSQDAKENYAFEYKRDAEGLINEVNITGTYNSYLEKYKIVIEYMD